MSSEREQSVGRFYNCLPRFVARLMEYQGNNQPNC